MIQKIKENSNLISNMGIGMFFLEFTITIKTKIGWQKKVFPTNLEFQNLQA